MASGRVVVDLALPATSGTPRRARSAVAEHFGGHPRCGDLLVCVSEIVTNAVLHAGTTLRLVVRERGTTVRVEVTDDDPAIPVRRRPAPDSPTGRGLLLIDELATRWGVDGRRNGKTVWLEVR